MDKRLHKSGRIMKGSAMSDDELKESLLKVEGNRPDSLGICTQWHRNPEGPQAWSRIEVLQAALAQAEAERDNLAAIVQGWHYLAVGPDEMGDYYTHKQLVKLSEPYASPALRAITKGQHHD
jgi:hypothetical protein